jgi:hypothetical protein
MAACIVARDQAPADPPARESQKRLKYQHFQKGILTLKRSKSVSDYKAIVEVVPT